MDKVVEKFLKYVTFDTKSSYKSGDHPSSRGQLFFGEFLKNELLGLGLTDVTQDKFGYVMGTLPSNSGDDSKVLGLVAHMDTSPDAEGKNVNPKIVKKYDGKDIVLNIEKNIVLSPKDFPEVKNYVGEDLIVTDGNTLLGADDKAGVAEIIASIEYLIENPQIKHGKIRVCFTPDEEIGEGADNLDMEKLGVDYAYTIDGGSIGEIEYENFNAAVAKVKIEGRSVHPGSAKNKMINSILLGQKFLNELPKEETPVATEGYEGFYHITEISGSVEESNIEIIIRDFEEESFENRKKFVKNVGDRINGELNANLITVEIKEQYRNMKEKIEPVMFLIENLVESMKECHVTPKVQPIRGGTDGARMSFMGVPTPNMFTGGENFHGKFEYIPINSMKKAVEVIVNLVQKFK